MGDIHWETDRTLRASRQCPRCDLTQVFWCEYQHPDDGWFAYYQDSESSCECFDTDHPNLLDWGDADEARMKERIDGLWADGTLLRTTPPAATGADGERGGE